MSDRPLTIADFPAQPTPLARPHNDAPNVLVIVLDDVGFAQLAPFGSDIAMPTISKLADDGLRYRNYHVTAMCSPTRAAMLTGQNHHAVGMGFLPEVPIAYPGYNARIPKRAIALPRLMRDAGFSTFAVGKWHLAPRWEVSASGPFSQWPLGLGFERYYGFLAGDANQFAPELIRDNSHVEAPASWHDGYHLTEDLTDQALRMVQDAQQATPGKPFLLWFATGAQHAPHQAPKEWIDRFAGHFDAGWDVWRAQVIYRQREMGIIPVDTTPSERPPWVPPWDSLDASRRKLFARMMEVYAGFLAHTDAQIGRLLSGLDTLGLSENTMVMVCSDNGASAEGGPHGSFNEMRFTHDRLDDVAKTVERIDELGGPTSYEHYPWGWAWAGNTPFKLWKRFTWLGGVRAPLIVRWPKRIDPKQNGSVRNEFCHAVDIAPTILDATSVKRPASIDGVSQRPFDGKSIITTFESPEPVATRQRQYFELLGSRAIYLDGWKATTNHVGAQISIERELVVGSHNFADDKWHLYDLANDFAECNDLAGRHPERLEKLKATWWDEAEANQVLPLDDTFTGRAIAMEPNLWPAGFSATYRPGGGPIAEDFLPPMGPGFTLLAQVTCFEPETSGIVCALGDWNNGWSLAFHDGLVVASMSLFGDRFCVRSAGQIEAGEHEIAIEYRRHAPGGGPLRLFVDDELHNEVEIPTDLPFRWQIGGAGLRIGHDEGLPVDPDYDTPFPFTGDVAFVQIDSHALTPPSNDTQHVHRLVARE